MSSLSPLFIFDFHEIVIFLLKNMYIFMRSKHPNFALLEQENFARTGNYVVLINTLPPLFSKKTDDEEHLFIKHKRSLIQIHFRAVYPFI